jgi:uncharacterized repeat protein (TIGR02543 family)
MRSKQITIVFCFVLLLFLLSGCITSEKAKISSIEVVSSSGEDVFDMDAFDLSKLNVKVYYSDDTVAIIPLTESMLSLEHLALLGQIGTHEITVFYQGFTDRITITLSYSVLKTKLMEIYMLAVTNQQIPLTYEEWLASIRGEDGKSIKDAYIQHGHLILVLSDDTTIDCGMVVGQDGQTVELRLNQGELQWKYSNETDWHLLIPIHVLSGMNGVGISELSIDENGELWITYTDGIKTNLGYIVGKNGNDGVGIQSVDLDENEHLIVTYTDSSSINLGKIKGENGIPVELNIIEGQIVWKYENANEWNVLIALSTLTGQDGNNGKEVIFQVADGYIQWQYVLESEWKNLIEISSLIGERGLSGKEIILRIHEGSIGWSYDDEDIFHPLIEITSLTGSQGRGIINTEINNVGELIVYYNDESIQNLGQLLKLHTVVYKDHFGYVIDVQMILHGMNAITPTPPVKTGYVFSSWSQDSLLITSNRTIIANYQALEYTLTFDSNGGSPVDAIEHILYGTMIKLPTPVREGYQFKGWFLGDSVHDAQWFNNSQIVENCILYARWEPKLYTVIYQNFDGSILSKQTVMHGNSSIDPVVPIRHGYQHIGWSHSGNSITSHLIITAIYESVDYTITYFNPDGSYHHTDVVSYMEQASPEIPSQDGFVFTGWKIAEPVFNGYLFWGWNYSGEYIDQHTLIEDNMIVVASWALVSETFEWIVVSDSIHLTSYIGDSKRLYLPLIIDDKPVVHITSGTFSNSTDITHLVLTESILTIDSNAFVDSSIEYLYINKTATWLDSNSVFSGMSSLKQLVFNKQNAFQTITSNMFNSVISLEKITLPDQLTTIESGAFMYHPSLQCIVIPQSVTSIGEEAFMYASSLTRVEFELGSTLEVIESSTFKNATVLKDIISIPASVKTIEAEAFSGNYALTNLTFEENSTLETIHAKAFYQAHSLQELNLPSSLQFIGDHAFVQAFELISISFGDQSALTYIGFEAFAEASSLESIIIPEWVNYLGEGAFLNAQQLNSITFLGNALTVIPYRAFFNASSLTEIINFPISITHIGDEAFKNCFSLIEMMFPEDSELVVIGKEAFRNAYALTALFIPEKVTTIKDAAFADALNLISVTFSEESSLSSISDFLFYNAYSLVSIKIPSSVVSIGFLSFGNNYSLESIEFDSDGLLDEIGMAAFESCTMIRTLVLPASLTSIREIALGMMASLEEIQFHEDTVLMYLGFGAFHGTQKLKTIHIPEGLETLLSGTFFHSSLEYIYLPKSLKTVQSWAFANTSHLIEVNFHIESEINILLENTFLFSNVRRIVLPDGLHEIANDAFMMAFELEEIIISENSRLTVLNYASFMGAMLLKSIYLPESVNELNYDILHYFRAMETLSLSPNHPLYMVIDGVLYNRAMTEIIFYPKALSQESYVIPLTILSIDQRIFESVLHLKHVIIHEHVESLGDTPFAYALKLESISVDANNQNYASQDGILYSKDMKTLVKYPAGLNLQTFALPSGVEVILDHAFAYAQYLSEVTLNNGALLHIKSYAFYQCNLITFIEIPETVTLIDMNALDFSYVVVATFIIHRHAIDGITILGSYPAFGYLSEHIKIYVPQDSFEDYYNDPSWEYYKDNLFPMNTST